MIKEDEEKIKNAKERETQWNDSLHYMLRLFSNYDSYSDYEYNDIYDFDDEWAGTGTTEEEVPTPSGALIRTEN